MAETIASARWVLAGFGRTGNSRHQSLPRNLMGFQDGTSNIKIEDTFSMKNFVWASEPASPAWMRGGSYLVARRIQIALALWDDTGLEGQEQTIGREKVAGSLLAKVPPSSHIELSRPASNGGQEILRRGYSFTDGIDSSGDTAVGLMFLCYQSDPAQARFDPDPAQAGRQGRAEPVRHSHRQFGVRVPARRREGRLRRRSPARLAVSFTTTDLPKRRRCSSLASRRSPQAARGSGSLAVPARPLAWRRGVRSLPAGRARRPGWRPVAERGRAGVVRSSGQRCCRCGA